MPCGALVDTFVTLDPGHWQAQHATGQSGHVVLEPLGSNNRAWIDLQPSGQYDECYTSFEIVSAADTNLTAFGFFDGGQDTGIGYVKSGNAISVDFMFEQTAATVTHLGIALSAGKLYYFYYDGAWHLAAQKARPSFMNNGGNDTIEIECVGNGEACVIDDFNVVPIQLSDLP
jgi:hypothetical protein